MSAASPATNRQAATASSPSLYGSVPEGDLLGLDHHHAEGIDESEALLRQKRAHQAHDAEQLQQQRVKDRKSSHGGEGRRHTGFTKRPSALATAGPKRRSSRSSSINGGRSDAESDQEGGDDDDEEWIPDLFVFEYGTVVIWGMTEREEKRVLAGL